jgi:hypothetical protein
MPLVSPIDIAALSSPIPIPENTGGGFDSNTQENYTAMTQGSGVLSPIGSGNTTQLRSGTAGGGSNMDLTPPPEFESITGEALESGGANVGGLVKTEQEVIPTDIKFATQEDEILDKQETQYEDQVDEYQSAYDKAKANEATLDEEQGAFLRFARKTQDFGIDDGMSAARGVKRKDRKEDRKARKGKTYNAETGEYEKTGDKLRGRAKRLARKAQRKNRKSAFKDFKDDQLDDAYVDITNLEN